MAPGCLRRVAATGATTASLRVEARRGRPGRVGPHGYALEATLDRSYDPRTLAERTARAAALCGRPDPRPRLRCLRRNFGGSSDAALLRRGRDRRSDLGRGRRDFAGARGRPAQEPPLPSLGHQDGARVRPDQDRRPPARRAATRTSPTRPGTATTTHASTTGSKLTYTLAGDSSPVTPLGARPRKRTLGSPGGRQ